MGTIKSNKRELTPLPQKKSKRQIHSSLFAFSEDMTVVSYIPKARRNVLLISSLHRYANIDIETGDMRKPEIITFYKQTKSGVDVLDHILKCYQKYQALAHGYNLLNLAAINAFIYRGNNPNVDDYSKKI